MCVYESLCVCECVNARACVFELVYRHNHIPRGWGVGSVCE